MNKTAATESLSTLLESLRHACIRMGLPYFIAIVKSNDSKKTQYYTNALSPAVAQIQLNDDIITPQLLIMNGFDTAEPNTIPDYEKPESVRNGVKPVYSNELNYVVGIKNNVAPILDKIEAICKADKLPYIIILVESDMDGKTVYQTRRLTAAELKMSLTDDRIEKVSDVISGMVPVAPIYMPTIIEDMFDI